MIADDTRLSSLRLLARWVYFIVFPNLDNVFTYFHVSAYFLL